MAASPPGSAKNLAKAFALLRVLLEHGGGMTLVDLSRGSGIPKPTAHRLLGALVEEGMVREDAAGRYRLGPQCLVLGSAFLDGLDLRKEARDILEELAAQTGETCHLGIRDESRVVYIEKVESDQPVQLKSGVGFTAPLYTTALGKVLLAYDPEIEVQRVIEQGLERCAPNTITDPRSLHADLAGVRERGFAVDNSENEEGIRCVASPVFGHEGKIIASISVSGPEYRIPVERLEELGYRTLQCAVEISRRMGCRYDMTNLAG